MKLSEFIHPLADKIKFSLKAFLFFFEATPLKWYEIFKSVNHTTTLKSTEQKWNSICQMNKIVQLFESDKEQKKKTENSHGFYV